MRVLAPPPDDTQPLRNIDPEQCPILARHWPGLPERAHRPALRLVTGRPSNLPEDPGGEAVERLIWDAYVAAVDAHDHHRTASTKRSRSAALLAWQSVYLAEHGEARP